MEHEGTWRNMKEPKGVWWNMMEPLQRCWWRHLNLVWVWAMCNSRMMSCCVCSHRCHMLVTWKGLWAPVQKKNMWMWKQQKKKKKQQKHERLTFILCHLNMLLGIVNIGPYIEVPLVASWSSEHLPPPERLTLPPPALMQPHQLLRLDTCKLVCFVSFHLLLCWSGYLTHHQPLCFSWHSGSICRRKQRSQSSP